MNKSLIPVEEALGCSQCGGNNDCLIPCNTFYRLLHSITEIHEEHQKLQAVREQNADDKQIELLSIILNRLSNQACALVSLLYILNKIRHENEAESAALVSSMIIIASCLLV